MYRSFILTCKKRSLSLYSHLQQQRLGVAGLQQDATVREIPGQGLGVWADVVPHPLEEVHAVLRGAGGGPILWDGVRGQ